MNITIEDDATPLVHFVGTTLRKSSERALTEQVALPESGSYSVTTEDGIQSATLTFAGDEVHVVHGVDAESNFTLSFDIDGPFAWSVDQADSADARALRALLNPPLLEWKNAAQRFWDLNQGTPGFPDQLIVRCSESSEEITFGSEGATYVITGPALNLSRVFEGIDSIGDAAYMSRIKVEGSFAQLSVMVGAGWKVRFYG